jgi:hypothetical protein
MLYTIFEIDVATLLKPQRSVEFTEVKLRTDGYRSFPNSFV